MLNIPINFFEDIKLKRTFFFEEEKNRGPILEYNVNIYSQFDFKTWESEQKIILIKCSKNIAKNASVFLLNVIKILQIKNSIEFKRNGESEKDITKIINEIKVNLKYDLNIKEGVLDFLILNFEWNYKEIILETETQFVYLRWSTSA